MAYEYNEKLLLELDAVKSTTELKKFINSHLSTLDAYMWYKITTHKHFGFSVVTEEQLPNLAWEEISMSFQLTDEQLEKYVYYLNWYCISNFQKLSVKFIKKYKDELSLDQLINNEKLEKDARDVAVKLYEKYNDSEHHLVWKENLKNSLIFRPRPKLKIGITDEEKIYKSIPTVDVINTMQKDQIKPLLDNLGVKYLYKNTIQELRDMLKAKKVELLPKAKQKSNDDYDKYLLAKIDRLNPIKKVETESEETPIKEEKKEVVKQPIKKEKRKKQKDYSKMSKAELKAILEKRKVRVYYHDTLDILRTKCLESEGK